MTIRVLSFDFDGCLFHLNYINSDNKDVIAHNKPFLDEIKQGNQAFSKVYTFVGSNRQSKKIDDLNHGVRGSCFPAISKISNCLGTILDSFLLADVHGDLPAGTSYDRAIDQEYKGVHSEWLADETKVTIMYAQMHKIANENPGEEIILDFYDDRGNGARAKIDILEKLRDFYTKYPDLIPNNVTLRLHQYSGKGVTPIAEIKGTGFIDVNYRQTVKDLSTQAVNGYNDGINLEIHVADKAHPDLLLNRREKLMVVSNANHRMWLVKDPYFDPDSAGPVNVNTLY